MPPAATPCLTPADTRPAGGAAPGRRDRPAAALLRRRRRRVLARLAALAVVAVLAVLAGLTGAPGSLGAGRVLGLAGLAGLVGLAVRAAYRRTPRAVRLLLPPLPAGTRPGDVRVQAEVLGRSSTAPLIALPGTTLVPLAAGRGLAGVAVRGRVAVSLGLPVAVAGLEADALAELTDVCGRRGLLPALLGLDERERCLAEEAGYAVVRIGVEAFLDPAAFTTAGSRRANVRHSVTRAERGGVEVLRYDDAARTPARDAQLASISAGWVERKGGPELGFTLGRFDVDRLDEQEVVVAVVGRATPDERVVAFVTWLPYDGGRRAVLDLMRRSDDCPPGTMEKLVVDSVADAARRGRTRLSLGGVPLASTTAREGRAERLLGWAYDNGRAVYDAHGLFRFKDKFAPEWEPLHLAAPAAADLPRVALAVTRAFLPPAAVRSVLRTAAAREWASVRARVAAAERPAGRGGRLGRSWVPALVGAALVAVAAATRAPFGVLPGGVVASAAWSTEAVLDGEVWRAATASLLTRDAPMLVAMVASLWVVLGLVQRLVGAAAALATWGLGCLVGYLGTAAGVGLLAAYWGLAEAASRTVDFGPSGGIAAGLAVVAVVLRHRAVTAVVVGGLLVGSALHHQIADVEHLVAFAAAWVVTRARRARQAAVAPATPVAGAGPAVPAPVPAPVPGRASTAAGAGTPAPASAPLVAARGAAGTRAAGTRTRRHRRLSPGPETARARRVA